MLDTIILMKTHLIEEKNSILNKFISEIRDVNIQKDSLRFRRNIERIGEILGYELSKSLSYSSVYIETPLGKKKMQLSYNDVVLCSILRAGLPLHQGLLNSFDDAENEENSLPLEYENTENPQQIYARIDNGTYCHGISEFGLNIIQVPNVSPTGPLQKCDTNTDGFINFDLTNVEVDVLGVRQDDIAITYHPSFYDAEANTNIINNPKLPIKTANIATEKISKNCLENNIYSIAFL